MAELLGKRLLGEVEEVGIGEILNTLRLQDHTEDSPSPFGFLLLDRILHATTEGRSHTTKTPPVVELTSLHAGAGATHLLYHLTALAVLPRECGGRQSCAIIFDTDGHFDVDRLASQLRTLIGQHNTDNNENETILQALRHVHNFHPQSLSSLTTTVEALPSYLFDQGRHFSFDRSVGFVAIDSASAFYWQDRSKTEDAAFYAKTSGDTEPLSASGYVSLTAAIKKTCTALQCPAIFTSWHLSPMPTTPHATRSFRSSLPPPLATLPTLRLACQVVLVKKFPPLISVEGAMREAGDRLAAVEEGKFECLVNEWNVDERTLRRLQNVGSGFEFRVTADGVVMKE